MFISLGCLYGKGAIYDTVGQGLQISQISWILGTSTKFVLLKISGSSIMTRIAN